MLVFVLGLHVREDSVLRQVQASEVKLAYQPNCFSEHSAPVPPLFSQYRELSHIRSNVGQTECETGYEKCPIWIGCLGETETQ